MLVLVRQPTGTCAFSTLPGGGCGWNALTIRSSPPPSRCRPWLERRQSGVVAVKRRMGGMLRPAIARRPRPSRACVYAAAAGTPPHQHGTSSLPGDGLVRPGRGRVCGGLGVEFLAVAGGLGTAVALVGVPAAAALLRITSWYPPQWLAIVLVAMSSFSYGVMLARFDLYKLRKLKLTVAFMMLTRLVCRPFLAKLLSCASALVRAGLGAVSSLSVSSPALLDATAVVSGPLSSMTAPVLASFMLLSLAPIGYSPSVAMLSPFMYPTLFAHLTLLNLLICPVFLMLPHVFSLALHKLCLSSIGASLPVLAAPPGGLLLMVATTLPAVAALLFARFASRRWIATVGLAALPCAWFSSALLLASAIGRISTSSLYGLAGSLVVCGGTALAMGLLGRVLSTILDLDVRAKRTLILYLCTQGTSATSGLVVPGSGMITPTVASAAVGLLVAYVLSKRWSKVVVRTSIDHF
jgi:hypothetical protein